MSHRFGRLSVYMFWAMSRVPDELLIRNNCQGGACWAVPRKVLNDNWVPDDLLVLDDLLIRDDR